MIFKHSGSCGDIIHFVGLPEEYRDFQATFKLRVPLARTPTFLDTARAIAACRLFIGNQSSAFWLAEALKVRRILEVYPHAPNVSPCGPHGYEFINQGMLEELVADLLK